MTCPFCGEPITPIEEAINLRPSGTAHRRCRDASRAQIHAARTRPKVKTDLSQAERCARCSYPDAGGLCDLDGEKVCYGCLLIARGKRPFEQHHVLGWKNSDEMIDVPASLHQYLTRQQREWPKALEANVSSDPLLFIAANVAAYRDFAAYAATYFGSFLDYVVGLQGWLVEQLGERWWEQTDLQALWTASRNGTSANTWRGQANG